MRNKKIWLAALLLMAAALTVPIACQSQAQAQFEVTSLVIKPAEIDIGGTVQISAQVTNAGQAAGTYMAVLTVDGAKTYTKNVYLEPGNTQDVTFSLLKDKAGAYEIGVGDRTAMLTVNPKLVARPVELKYDDGLARDCIGSTKPCTGYLVDFVPPSTPFTISKIRVLGLVYGSPGFHIGESDLRIWDKDEKVIYSTSFPGDQFPLRTRLGPNIESTGNWVDIIIPDIKVEDYFYVHVYTGIPTGQGFRMGAEDNVTNTHSNVTVRGDNGVDTIAQSWPYSAAYWYGDKNRVNWMVRIVGDTWVPQE